MFLPLLALSGLVAASSTTGRQPRLHELRRRLNLVDAEPESGARARWRFVYRMLGFVGMEPFQVNDPSRVVDSTTAAILEHSVGALYTWEDVPGFLRKLPVSGPSPHPEMDRILPWLARQVRAMAQDTYDETLNLDGQDIAIEKLRWGAVKEVIGRSASALREEAVALSDWAAETTPNLDAFSWNDALLASDRWHAAFRPTYATAGVPSAGIVVARWPDGATIQRLLTRTNCEDEGAAMGHCVGGHYGGVAAGRALIFSYRDATGEPHCTWELGVVHRWNWTTDRQDLVTFVVNDLEGPGNEAVKDALASERVACWFLEVDLSLGGWAGKLRSDGNLGEAMAVLPREAFSPVVHKELKKQGLWTEDEARYLALEARFLHSWGKVPDWSHEKDPRQFRIQRYLDAMDEYGAMVGQYKEDQDLAYTLSNVIDAENRGDADIVVDLLDALSEAGTAADVGSESDLKSKLEAKGLTGGWPSLDAAETDPDLLAWTALLSARGYRSRQYTRGPDLPLQPRDVAHRVLRGLSAIEASATARANIAERFDVSPEEADELEEWHMQLEKWRINDDLDEVVTSMKSVFSALEDLFGVGWSFSEVTASGRRLEHHWVHELSLGTDGDSMTVGCLAFTTGYHGSHPAWIADDGPEDEWHLGLYGEESPDSAVDLLWKEGLVGTVEEVLAAEAKRKAACASSGMTTLPVDVMLEPGGVKFAERATAAGAAVPRHVLKALRMEISS